ncbi:spore coat protein [Bacillus nitratireducens]|uniref:CotY/CotZ family spore coat protein n=1 Tax=Bacillus nitratireducens TaxID=2026193 RepID=UPI0005CC9954|nr:CotY/CotZ family spore coat protein [Bacillus nitratireducens]UNP77450.1 spore coat protein [Bacillus nitratireducens]
MSCNENKHHSSSYCVADVVKFINELQDCSTSTCGSGCEIPFLGAHNSASVANTRPFILYTKIGTPFETFAPGANPNCKSQIFRVESVDEDSCAVLRALTVVDPTVPNTPTPPVLTTCNFLNESTTTLRATPTCITVDLSYFCGIQCLRDVSI